MRDESSSTDVQGGCQLNRVWQPQVILFDVLKRHDGCIRFPELIGVRFQLIYDI